MLDAVRADETAAIAVVADVAQRFRQSHKAWLGALAQWERVLERTEHRVGEGTVGLTVDQWMSLCERKRINTTGDARAVARAVRAEATIRRAITDAACRQAEAGEAVRTARAEVVSVTGELLRYGALGQQLVGLTRDELQRLSRPDDPRAPRPRPCRLHGP